MQIVKIPAIYVRFRCAPVVKCIRIQNGSPSKRNEKVGTWTHVERSILNKSLLNPIHISIRCFPVDTRIILWVWQTEASFFTRRLNLTYLLPKRSRCGWNKLDKIQLKTKDWCVLRSTLGCSKWIKLQRKKEWKQ